MNALLPRPSPTSVANDRDDDRARQEFQETVKLQPNFAEAVRTTSPSGVS